MNNQDFNKWLDDFCETFPDHGAWIANMSQVTQQKWRDVFVMKRIALQDALRANLAILSGDAPRIANYDRDYIADAIVTAVAKIGTIVRRRELSEAESFEQAKREFSTSGWPAGKIFREVRRRMEAGRTAAEVTREVCREIERADIEKETRYRCLTCLDTLRVQCVSIRTVADLRAVANGNDRFGRASVWCHCQAAVAAADAVEHAARSRSRDDFRPEPRYDPLEHLKASGDVQARAAEMITERANRNRVKSFDSWNQREVLL